MTTQFYIQLFNYRNVSSSLDYRFVTKICYRTDVIRDIVNETDNNSKCLIQIMGSSTSVCDSWSI